MGELLSVCASFVTGLFALPVPGLGLTFFQLILGFWMIVAAGWLFKKTFLGDD